MNRNIDKNIYKEASYGKKSLFVASLIVFIISVIALVAGIILFVNGILVSGVGAKVWRIIVGVILTLFGLVFGYASYVAFFTSFALLKNKSGNVKDGNRAVGTVNILKCDKCGHENELNAEFCKKCGESMKDFIECECGTRCPKDAEFCSSCGKKFKED